MPYRRKDSEYWWTSYQDESGKQIRISTETADLEEAKAVESQLRRDRFLERQFGVTPDKSFDDVMYLYLTEKAPQKASYIKDVQRAAKLNQFFKGKMINKIEGKDVAKYSRIRAVEVANATINREIALLSCAIEHVNKEHGLSLSNPTKNRKLKEPEGRVRWITEAEARRLIDCAASMPKAGHYLDPFITIALNTGCRYQEIMGLEWSRVDYGAGRFYLHSRHTKSNKSRVVPMNSNTLSAINRLRKWQMANHVTSKWVFSHKNGGRQLDLRGAFKDACDQAGIVDFRIHDLRHTCASWLAQKGIQLQVIKELLGHSTVKVTEKYAHLSPSMMDDAVKSIENLGSNTSDKKVVSITGGRKHD